jgi:hypothetical protein
VKHESTKDETTKYTKNTKKEKKKNKKTHAAQGVGLAVKFPSLLLLFSIIDVSSVAAFFFFRVFRGLVIE